MSEAQETEAAEETGLRSQMWKHEDLAGYLTEEGLIDAESSQAEVIAAAFAKRNEYRRSDRYTELVEEHRAEAEQAKEAKAAARAKAKAEREAAAAEAKAEKEAAKAAAKADKEAKPAKKTAAKKTAAKKTTAKGKGAKAKADDEDVFS